MSCTYPLMTNTQSYGIVNVPCGRCMGCRLDRARDWSLRCIHEAQMHEENCFITLTYNNDNLPEDGSISKDVLQRFFKRLREKISPKLIRYYACGEYGSKSSRPHYHALIFGYQFPDLELHHVHSPTSNRFTNSAVANKIYTSEILQDLWKFGFSTVGEVSMQSAGYVCRYIRKKIGGEMAIDHYKGREPEFALMSRRPGLGATWFEKYYTDVFPKDFVTHEGKKYPIPRYYTNKLMRRDWNLYERVKADRAARAVKPDCVRRGQKEKYLQNVTKTLNRRIENV
jgi:ferredoxin-thioredoxin reductase catalytic subunit